MQKALGSQSILDSTPSATTWFSDSSTNNRSRNARKSGLTMDDDHVAPNSGPKSIGEPIYSSPQSASSGVKIETVETSRIVTTPAFSRSDSLTGIQAGGTTGGTATEQPQKRSGQDLAQPVKSPSVSSQDRLTRAPDIYRSPASRESIATDSLSLTRQGLPSNNPGRDVDGRRAKNISQPKTQAVSSPNGEATATKAYLQIKSKILNKEFWMRDENARDCFYCGDPFSTFRRKHHCS